MGRNSSGSFCLDVSLKLRVEGLTKLILQEQCVHAVHVTSQPSAAESDPSMSSTAIDASQQRLVSLVAHWPAPFSGCARARGWKEGFPESPSLSSSVLPLLALPHE